MFESCPRHHCDVSGHWKPSNPRFGGFCVFELGLGSDVVVEGEVSAEAGVIHSAGSA